MLFAEEHYRFMYAALQEAEQAMEEEEVPVGAVVVHNNRIIGRGYNQTERLKDPTAHAEMIAITAAAEHLKENRLTNCDIYISLEPCLMCTGALLHARIRALYFAAFDAKFGACGSLYNIADDGKYNHTIKVYSGLYETESQQLLREFFRKKRSNTKGNGKH